MNVIEEMMVRSGLIKFGEYYISGAAVTSGMVVYDKNGTLTHRVEKSTIGNDIIVRDVRSGLVAMKFKVTTSMV